MTINYGKTIIHADKPEHYNNDGTEFWLAYGDDEDGKHYEIIFDSKEDVDACTPSSITRVYRGSSYSSRIDDGTIEDWAYECRGGYQEDIDDPWLQP